MSDIAQIKELIEQNKIELQEAVDAGNLAKVRDLLIHRSILKDTLIELFEMNLAS